MLEAVADLWNSAAPVWGSFGAVAAAAVGAGFTIYRFLAERRRAFALERTKFIFEQARILDKEEDLRLISSIFYGKDPARSINRFLEEVAIEDISESQALLVMKFENYLNFLWRLAYAHLKLGTITIDDLDAFGFYFYSVYSHPGLREYCQREGFYEIIAAAEKLKPLWERDDREALALARV